MRMSLALSGPLVLFVADFMPGQEPPHGSQSNPSPVGAVVAPLNGEPGRLAAVNEAIGLLEGVGESTASADLAQKVKDEEILASAYAAGDASVRPNYVPQGNPTGYPRIYDSDNGHNWLEIDSTKFDTAGDFKPKPWRDDVVEDIAQGYALASQLYHEWIHCHQRARLTADVEQRQCVFFINEWVAYYKQLKLLCEWGEDPPADLAAVAGAVDDLTVYKEYVEEWQKRLFEEVGILWLF